MAGRPRSQLTSQRMDLRLGGRTLPKPVGSPNPKPQTGTGTTPGWGIGVGTTLTGLGEKLTRMSLVAKNPYGFESWNAYWMHLQNTPWTQNQIDYIDMIEREMRGAGYGNGWPGQVTSGPHLGQLVPANGAPLRSFKPGQTIRFGHGHSFRLPYSENVRVPISTKWGVYKRPKGTGGSFGFGRQGQTSSAGGQRSVPQNPHEGYRSRMPPKPQGGFSGGGSPTVNSGVDPSTGLPEGWGSGGSTGGGSEGGGGGTNQGGSGGGGYSGGGGGRGGGGGESGGGGGSADIGGFGTGGHMVAEHYLGGGQSNPAVSMRTTYHS